MHVIDLCGEKNRPFTAAIARLRDPRFLYRDVTIDVTVAITRELLYSYSLLIEKIKTVDMPAPTLCFQDIPMNDSGRALHFSLSVIQIELAFYPSVEGSLSNA